MLELDQDVQGTIQGPAASGKTQALLARARRAADTLSSGSVLLTAPGRAQLDTLREAFDAEHPHVTFRLLTEIAFEAVTDGIADPDDRPRLVDDLVGARIFQRAAAELLSLEWSDPSTAEIDPEIAGLRTPERFLAAAYRLIRKLRAARIEPEEFASQCRRGTTSFHARPPNFASPDLILQTSASYRDSLRVDAAELERQRLREVDLVKVLARLYVRYLERVAAEKLLPPCDALAEATTRLLADATLRATIRARYPFACVDDAQDLLAGELALLQALYGEELNGVTLAGDVSAATRTFVGARGERAFVASTPRLTLSESVCPPIIESAARALTEPPKGRFLAATSSAATAAEPAVMLYRASTPRDEAEYVADSIAALLRDGVPSSRIAIIARSVRSPGPYVTALLARDVPIDVGGDACLYEFTEVRDALALLWSVADPYRHDWLLRTLETPWLALSDASIALLCGEPGDPQTALFEPGSAEGEAARGRRDRRRDLRLGWNVVRGDRDLDLPEEARERLRAFRAARERWEQAERTLPLPALAERMLSETFGDAPRLTAALLARLRDEIAAFAAREPLGSLLDFLTKTELVMLADEELHTIEQRDRDAVALLSVEAAKGRSFDHVFLIDARAGAFPRYYAPDAFLFYPSLGMIPKENVGEGACASRTAKFTYALYKFKTRERYVEEERRAFAYAVTRARKQLWVSASGRPTRGNAAPELLEELRTSGLPGVCDITMSWRPSFAAMKFTSSSAKATRASRTKAV